MVPRLRGLWAGIPAASGLAAILLGGLPHAGVAAAEGAPLMPSRSMSRSRLTRAIRDDALIRALLAEGETQLAREAAARAYGWITRNGRLPVAGAAAGYAAQFAALAWLRPAERAA